MWLKLSFLILIFIVGPIKSYDPIPCCHIAYGNPKLVALPFQIDTIYLPGNSTCEGFSLAKIKSTDRGPRGVVYVDCANGWNVIAFLLHVMSEIGSDASHEVIKLKRAMLELQSKFRFGVLLHSDLNKFKYIWKNG